MKVLTVANRKGGVGKTTTSVYLALCLARLGQRVLVIDLDPQGSATQLLVRRTFIPEDKTIGDVLTGDVSSLKEVIVASDAGLPLDVAPASDRIKDVERRIDRNPLRDFLLRRALVGLDYDYVVVDTSPSADSNLVRNGLVSSTHVIVPVESSLLAISGYVLALEDLDSLFRHLPEAERPIFLGPLLTRFDPREGVSGDAQEYLREHSDSRFAVARLFDAVIRTNTRLKSVIDKNEMRRGRKGWDDHMALAKELMSRVEESQTSKPAVEKARVKKSPASPKSKSSPPSKNGAEKKPAERKPDKPKATPKTKARPRAKTGASA